MGREAGGREGKWGGRVSGREASGEGPVEWRGRRAGGSVGGRQAGGREAGG